MKDKALKKSIKRKGPESVLIKIDGKKAILVSISEYKGNISLDIREQYYIADTKTWGHTSKGCKIPPDKYKQFRIAVAKLTK